MFMQYQCVQSIDNLAEAGMLAWVLESHYPHATNPSRLLMYNPCGFDESLSWDMIDFTY
jgi:hypothetical protein